MLWFYVLFAAVAGLTISRLALWFMRDLMDDGSPDSFSIQVWIAMVATGAAILPMVIFLDSRFKLTLWSGIESRALLIAVIFGSATLLYFLEGRRMSYAFCVFSGALALAAAMIALALGG